MRIPILYQDADLVVVDKPGGLPTHAPDPADPYPGDAVRIVQAQLGLSYLGMHQRLDADTSGVLLFAARREANPALARAFAARTVRKEYLALVHGVPVQREGMIDAPVARLSADHYGVVSPADRQGQPARTRYRLLAAADDRRFSLVEAVPETGRSHQIRVHLAYLGIPVAGDPLYGPGDRPAPRLFLHAYRLTVPHPQTGEPVTFTAPLPAVFERFQAVVPALDLAASGAHARLAVRRRDALKTLLRLAIARRAPLAGDPGTDIYRLVDGAADGLPGLAADRYGEALVASLYDDGPLPPAPILPALAEALLEASGARSLFVKYRPRQASRIADGDLARLAPPQPLLGPAMDETVAYEEGLAYHIRPGDGLSTGIFPDMRETRARVRHWAAGRTVLNCFAYTCAFGVAATAGGARRVLNLDLSKAVLQRGQENYQANGFAPDPFDFVYGDVFDWLGRLGRRNERFDLVILDPPGFSKTKSGRFSAAHDYGALATLAAGITAPDGLLLACNNVAELSWRSFRDRVLTALASAGRPAEVAGVYHEPAVDFPAPPGREPYLKMILLRLS